MKAVCTLLLLVFALPFSGFAQRCGFDAIHQRRMQSDPVYKAGIDEQQAWIRNYIQQNRYQLLNAPQAALYTIPVVVHVIHTGGAVGTIYNPSDAQIQGAIDYLNQVYDGTWPGTQGVGEIQIQFELATRDPNCNPTTGINRVNGSGLTNYTAQGVNANNTTGVDDIDVKNLSRWDPYRYYNIWVVNRIDGRDGTSGSFIGGFAYFPGAPPSLDGTVILATQMQSNRKTIPHELGHAFALYHPFQGASGATCPANADCTTEGDEVCDTDPITQPAGFVCRTGTNACTGTPYSINTESNYMNYTNCSTLFTADQKVRMLAAAASVFRKGLHTSWAKSATYPVLPFTPPIVASCTPVSSASGTSSGIGGFLNMTLAGRHYNSGTTQDDNGYVPATSCLNLVQLVPGNTYTMDLAPLAQNYEQVRAWIDYNNNGVFETPSEQVFFQNDIGPPAPFTGSVSTSFTVPAGAPANTMVRMRVLEEVSTRYGAGYAITGPCYNPVYGQAEDFPVWLSSAVVLPVTYRSFQVQASGDDVRISWETAQESGNHHFDIERSADGRSFHSIGRVAAADRPGRYQYLDANPGAGSWYYRLRQVDVDGQSKLSRVERIDITETNTRKYRLLSTLVQGDLRIHLGAASRDTRLRVFDMTGRVLLQRRLDGNAGQTVTVSLQGITMPAGWYILDIQDESGRFTQKFAKQ